MALESANRGIQISTGDGIVAHFTNLTAFATGDPVRLNELLVRLNALAGSSWQEIVRTITAGISESDYVDHPNIACVSVDEHKVSAFVYGAVELTVVLDGETNVLNGTDSTTWIDVILRGNVSQVHAGERTESSIVGFLRDGAIPAGGFLLQTTGPLLAAGHWSSNGSSIDEDVETDTSNGSASTTEPSPQDPRTEQAPDDSPPAETVQASPVETVQQSAELAETTQPEEAPQPQEEGVAGVTGMFALLDQMGRTEDDEFADLQTDDLETSTPVPTETADEPITAERAPDSADTPTLQGAADARERQGEAATTSTAILRKERPQLLGVHCPEGHFTAVESTCRTCDEQIASKAKSSKQTRPVLGHLVFDDGAVLEVDRPAVIGSNVPTGYTVNDEPTTIVRLDDGHDGVSDVQLEVHCSGWNVEVVDMQSRNGTYTMQRGKRQTRTRLRSGQAVVLLDGMIVETGTRTFTFGIGPHSP